MKAQADSTIPGEVKTEIAKMANRVARLSGRAKKTRSFLATKLLTEGFVNTAAF